MKKVLLYYPKFEGHQTRSPPLSLLTISGLLLQKNYEVKIFDAFTSNDIHNRVLENLKDSICVAFSVMTGSSIIDSLELAKKIKNKDPKIPIVWGGWHPSILPLQTIKHPDIDIIVRGQGEVTFFELVQCLEKKGSLKEVLGITYKTGRKIINNPDRPIIPLDDIPPMPYHLVEVEKYITKNIGERTLAYISSQGCPYSCAFCADVSIYKRRRLDLSAERVISDLKTLIETYNINAFMFDDANFFVNKERVHEICKKIIENKWNIKWGTSERVDHFLLFDKETLELIKNSGCSLLVVGAESGSQRVLDFLNKGFKVEDILKFSKICKEYNIKVHYDIMVGLPGETDDDLEKTKKLIIEGYKINKDSQLSISFYTPYPGTSLYSKVINEYGFKPPASLIEWSKYAYSFTDTSWVDKKYKKRLNTFLFYLQFAFLNEEFKKRFNRFKSFIWLLHYPALLRIKLNFFGLPIEKLCFDMIKNKINKKCDL